MILGIIHNDKLNFNDHLINGFKDKRGLITRLKQRVGLMKKMRFNDTKNKKKQ